MPHLRQYLPRAVLAAIVLSLLGACHDTISPPVPAAEEPLALHVVTCRADVRAGSVSCRGPATEPTPGLWLSAIVGGQGMYVLLASDNVSYASGVFQADVSITNLLAQPLGTPDGTTVTGIKVFFHSGPTVTSGDEGSSVAVADADGTSTFTASEPQPYYAYDEILAMNATSAAKTWRWNITGTVQTFEFSVYVQADIPVASGDWDVTPTPAFGTAEFTVNATSSAITFLWVHFDNYSCGSAFRDGSIGFGSSWPITGRQFSIDHSAPGGDRFVVEGTFSTLGDEVSGTWEFTLSGTTCSGTWQGTPAPVPLQLVAPREVAQNAVFDLEVRLDMTKSDAVAGAVAVEIGWDPSDFELGDWSGFQGAYDWWAIRWDGSGLLRVVLQATSGMSAEATILTLPYRAIGATGTAPVLSLDVLQVIASSTFDDISSALDARGTSVTIN